MPSVNRAAQHKNNRDVWATPDDVFDTICEAFEPRRFTLDVAASDANHKCSTWYTKEQNALLRSWEPPYEGYDQKEVAVFENPNLYWCNCPYSLKEEFLLKAWTELDAGHEGLLLLPCSMETNWFRHHITHQHLPRLVWPGRIQFLIDGKRMTRIDKRGKEVVSGNVGGSVLVAFVRGELPEVAGEPWVR